MTTQSESPRHRSRRGARSAGVARRGAVLRCALLAALALLAPAASAQPVVPPAQPTEAPAVTRLPRFSAMVPGGPTTGWQVLRPAPNAPDTVYSIVTDAGTRVLRAEANRSMSGLIHEVRVSPARAPILQWRWKVDGVVAGADIARKAGDDYAARVYVLFDYPAHKLPFATRAKLKLAETVYGQRIPTAALNYVWDNRAAVGSIHANAYTDRARMIVLRSGGDLAGRWLEERRDIAADFRAAFGEDPPDVVAVAIATDTDNTGERVVAWYGDIELRPR